MTKIKIQEGTQLNRTNMSAIPVEVVAVSTRVLVQVGLVVLVGGVESRGLRNLGADEAALVARHPAQLQLRLQLVAHLLSYVHLHEQSRPMQMLRNGACTFLTFRTSSYLDLVGTEDGGSVLGPDVVSLLVQSRRVVKHEEVLYQVFVRLLVTFKLQVVNFNVASLARAYLHNDVLSTPGMHTCLSNVGLTSS